MSYFNRSIYAPRLWFGIEKKFALTLIIFEIISLAIGDIYSRIISAVISLVLWFILYKCNEYDYIFFKVLIRHLKNKGKYPAQSSIHSKHYIKIKYKPN